MGCREGLYRGEEKGRREEIWMRVEGEEKLRRDMDKCKTGMLLFGPMWSPGTPIRGTHAYTHTEQLLDI